MVSQVSGVHRLSQSVGEETAQGCAGDKSSPPDMNSIAFSEKNVKEISGILLISTDF